MNTPASLLVNTAAYARLADGSDSSTETLAQLQEAKDHLHLAKVRKASALAAHNETMAQQGKLAIEVLRRVGTEALDDELVISVLAHFLSGSANDYVESRERILNAMNTAFHESYPWITAYYRGTRVVVEMEYTEKSSGASLYPSNMSKFLTLLNRYMDRPSPGSVSSVVVLFASCQHPYHYTITPSADQGFLVDTSSRSDLNDFEAPKRFPFFTNAINMVEEFDANIAAEERSKAKPKPWWKRR